MNKTEEILQDQIQVSELFHVYGELLSDRQKEFIRLYYDENLSLSEIAEKHDISRQAVHDAIKHGRRTLEKFESILHLLKTNRRVYAANQGGWRKKADMILEEMEKTIQSESTDLEARLMAQIASLRGILPGNKGDTPGDQSFEEEVAA